MVNTAKILLVQLYSNGDCLYATPVARQIKQDYPGCHLTWAIVPFCRNIIAHNPYVDDVMEVQITKNDAPAFKRFKKQIELQQKQGKFDHVFITHNSGNNQEYYDGCIRSSILRAYKRPVTVPVTPVLQLTKEEIQASEAFANEHQLGSYKHVVLFEFAPQSGQLNITKEISVNIAEAIIQKPGTAVILSSANKVAHDNPAIIDGSSLTLRETAALTHHCTMLLGCSSGITWITTTNAAKLLPMVQVLNANVPWVNPVSRDFERFQLPVEKVIELLDFDHVKIVDCVMSALDDFGLARDRYNQAIPLHFKATRHIVYQLLCSLEFGAIMRHVKVNREVYGNRFDFYKELLLGILTFPVTFLKNTVRKHLFR
ncbi:MAG: hypothetical protein V4722_25070 [Bacteroidota bacterium]